MDFICKHCDVRQPGNEVPRCSDCGKEMIQDPLSYDDSERKKVGLALLMIGRG